MTVKPGHEPEETVLNRSNFVDDGSNYTVKLDTIRLERVPVDHGE